MKKSILLIGLFIGMILLFSCRKEDQIIESSSAQVRFSTDSISFDTVFTTIGSVTKNFTIHNPYKESIKISSIRLGKGGDSQFRINIDGLPGAQMDVIIPPKDSIFGFVEVTVDPTNDLNPFFIEDEIQFFTNGNVKSLKLIAYGQNAIYFTPTTVIQGLPPFSIIAEENQTVTWTKDKPYVIYGYAVVDEGATLNIEAGTRIYFHNNGGLWVYQDANIQVNGTLSEPVLFRGDRLERDYDDVPGQWDRIWINEGSVNNNFNYAIIENAFIGIQAEYYPFAETKAISNNKLNLNNTIIRNASGFGLLGTLYQIDAENVLIENCGEYNVAITGAGTYNFKHCTFANYWNESKRETPLFYAQSYQSYSEGLLVGEPNVNVSNSIIHGSLENEWDFEGYDTSSVNFNFQNSLLKTNKVTANNARYANMVINPTDSIFQSVGTKDYHLRANSSAINIGNTLIGNQVPLDLEGISRTADSAPDAGCYEFQ
ncbi:choice-of-anchor Q domain-containing protein [Acidiluteibacter ferrifornacis]|uniref:Right-handed parallel beta-helix repeat-containing protein n=1 Tax=Acidiluteibacter ferrifornacis TaxID=2692424 RepID=A0A6N9NLB7_9FLAO|nr:choice-of-anchor Q domain-containing protein [Acidiluteibacter ferrifornacis]NBG66674.1 hypothetical protein [Acidiluteibacter ferrifornacis]